MNDRHRMPTSSDLGVGRVYTPPWNKKKLPPASPNATRHAAAINATVASASFVTFAQPLSPAQAFANKAEHARSPLSPQRDASDRGLAHAADVAGARGRTLSMYPVVSLSTQLAQVMSPAKPDFSPTTLGAGQRRRLCAAIEGLAEKYEVCSAAIPSFQTVQVILRAHKDQLFESVMPSLSVRAKAFLSPSSVSSSQQRLDVQQQLRDCDTAPVQATVSSSSSGRPGGACMEGSRVFVCELQQLLNSIRELEIGKGMHYKLDSHVETLYSTLNSSKSSSCAPKQGEHVLSLSDTVDTIALEQELAKALTALNDAKAREFAAQDRMAHKDKMLEEAAAEKQVHSLLDILVQKYNY